jgi:hypothetical protein
VQVVDKSMYYDSTGDGIVYTKKQFAPPYSFSWKIIDSPEIYHSFVLGSVEGFGRDTLLVVINKDTGDITLYRRPSSTIFWTFVTDMKSYQSLKAGDRMRVDVSGKKISIYRNEKYFSSIEVPWEIPAGSVGFRDYNPNERGAVDDIQIRAIVSPPQCTSDSQCFSVASGNYCDGDYSCYNEISSNCIDGQCVFREEQPQCLYCQGGCVNGACIQVPPSTEVCQDLISKVANPAEEFNDRGVIFYRRSYYTSYGHVEYINNQEYDTNTYVASWWTRYNIDSDEYEEYNAITYHVTIFNDTSIDLSSWVKERLQYIACQAQSYLNNDGEEYKVYICNWNILNQRQSLDSSENKYRQIFWYKDNVLVNIWTYVGDQLTESEQILIAQKRVDDFLDDLQDNRQEYVGWQDFNINYPLNNQIFQSLSQCRSEIPLDTCSPSWSCRTEPAICPEHGSRRTICVDNSCGERVEQEFSCTPGICSGCLVPRWFGDILGDNKCIPYGFRFEHTIGKSQELVEQESVEFLTEVTGDDGFFLDVESADRAVFILYDKEGNNYTYILTPGSEHTINIPDWDIIDLYLRVESIEYNPDGNSRVRVFIRYKSYDTVYDTISAYCDIDGQVKPQKTKDLVSGNWASCQNNYECSSNLCSGRECIEINDLLRQAKGFRGIGVRVLCALANTFFIQEYNQCVYDYLGTQA